MYSSYASAVDRSSSGDRRPNKIYHYKLVLLGETYVGKSSIVQRFVKGQFMDFQESTIGAAFLTQTVCLDDTTVKFEIWDTAGQERYQSLAPMYYRGAEAAIIVYDVTNEVSFARAKNWVRELQRKGAEGVTMVLAGNKADLVKSRSVNQEDARLYAAQNGLLYIETSAKTGANVADMFTEIAKRLPKVDETTPTDGARTPPTGAVDLTQQKRSQSAGCCK